MEEDTNKECSIDMYKDEEDHGHGEVVDNGVHE